MRSTLFLTVGLLLTAAAPSFARSVVHTRPSHAKTSAHATLKHTSATKTSKRPIHGVVSAATVHSASNHHESGPGMATDRATEIQMALIKQGYLNGEPSGNWDSSTIAAMEKLQGENGWQTRITPDARALIKLGLGPQDTPAQQ